MESRLSTSVNFGHGEIWAEGCPVFLFPGEAGFLGKIFWFLNPGNKLSENLLHPVRLRKSYFYARTILDSPAPIFMGTLWSKQGMYYNLHCIGKLRHSGLLPTAT